jgi:hypothetical protein
MKRSLLLLSLAAGTLAGCAGAYSGGGAGLRATVYGDAHAPRISLSDPAYVAIFDVRPGSGNARLLYPDPGAEQVQLQPGTRTLAVAGPEYDAWYATSHASSGGAGAVLLMVASREPLDLSGFAATRDARAVVGSRALWSNEAREAADALSLAVVRNPEGENWTSSVVWPRGPARGAGSLTTGASVRQTEDQRATGRSERKRAAQRENP